MVHFCKTRCVGSWLWEVRNISWSRLADSGFVCVSPPAESNCTYFKFFTTGENYVMFQKTTQKSESRSSPGSLGLPKLLSHLILPLPPLFTPSSSSSYALFFVLKSSACHFSHLFFSHPSLPQSILVFFCPLCLPSPHRHALSGWPLSALRVFESIPPTLRSSVSERLPNLSFSWQLYNILRSHNAILWIKKDRRALKAQCLLLPTSLLLYRPQCSD